MQFSAPISPGNSGGPVINLPAAASAAPNLPVMRDELVQPAGPPQASSGLLDLLRDALGRPVAANISAAAFLGRHRQALGACSPLSELYVVEGSCDRAYALF